MEGEDYIDETALSLADGGEQDANIGELLALLREGVTHDFIAAAEFTVELGEDSDHVDAKPIDLLGRIATKFETVISQDQA